MAKKDEVRKDIPYTGEERILAIDIVPEMKKSYLDYAMSVIVSRALPDVRDGLKPVHRRILYAMHTLGLAHTAKFRKSATIVGEVLGKYHPHGDSSVYDAMVKLAQDFSTRYPLVIPQGNFGSVDGDSAAAYRYTEAKLSKISGELLRDIEKDTVNFQPTYNNERKEPTVLPAVLPNLLLNGTLGIAVGMATKIPPHNLREVTEALIYLIDNKDATTEDLVQFVKGPDFPTGGIIFNEKDINHAYATGRGGVLCRGEAEIIETKSGSSQIIITSIPYQVNKAELIIKIADLVHEKRVEGIRDIRDESTGDVRIVIDLKGGGHPQKVLNALYKHTDLETMFHFNMLALAGGVPKLLSLSEILREFLKHRVEVTTRRIKFDLLKAEDREHILAGLKKALDHIDEIIKLIKASKDTPTAHAGLMKSFKFSDRQATAILDMKLQRLAGLERKKIEEELKEVRALIAELKALLGDPKKLMGLIKKEWQDLIEKYGDERRTRVVKGGAKNISVEDLVPDVENVLVLTSGGYVKRTDPTEYKKQKRGGSGVIDMNTKEEDFVSIFLTASTHSDILFFTDKGKVYQIKMYDLPEGKRATKGKSIMNFLSIGEGENITSILAMPKTIKEKSISLSMVTKDGVVKKASADSFKDVRRSGIVAIKLTPGDTLLSAQFVEKGDSLILVTSGAQAIRFAEKDVREMGRTAGGVRALKLRKGDSIISSVVVPAGEKDAKLLVLSEKGYGKKTKASEYKIQKRGGSGIKTGKVTPKTGKLMMALKLFGDDQELLAISKNGQIIRIDEADVPTLGRQTQGVRIMKLKDGDSIASLTSI
jgi:DNA gyrase subunit A